MPSKNTLVFEKNLLFKIHTELDSFSTGGLQTELLTTVAQFSNIFPIKGIKNRTQNSSSSPFMEAYTTGRYSQPHGRIFTRLLCLQ